MGAGVVKGRRKGERMEKVLGAERGRHDGGRKGEVW